MDIKYPPHEPMTFHKGLVTDSAGKEDPSRAFLTYGSAAGVHVEDADIDIDGGGAHKAAQAIEAIPEMLALIKKLDAWWSEEWPEGPVASGAIDHLTDETIELWTAMRAIIAKAA